MTANGPVGGAHYQNMIKYRQQNCPSCVFSGSSTWMKHAVKHASTVSIRSRLICRHDRRLVIACHLYPVLRKIFATSRVECATRSTESRVSLGIANLIRPACLLLHKGQVAQSLRTLQRPAVALCGRWREDGICKPPESGPLGIANLITHCHVPFEQEKPQIT